MFQHKQIIHTPLCLPRCGPTCYNRPFFPAVLSQATAEPRPKMATMLERRSLGLVPSPGLRGRTTGSGMFKSQKNRRNEKQEGKITDKRTEKTSTSTNNNNKQPDFLEPTKTTNISWFILKYHQASCTSCVSILNYCTA